MSIIQNLLYVHYSLMHRSAASRVQETIAKLFDRKDPSVKAYQDLAFNVALFATAIYLITTHGHKLAV